MYYALPFLKARASLANRKLITTLQGRSGDESARVGKTRTISTSGNITLQDNTKNNRHNGERLILFFVIFQKIDGHENCFIIHYN